MVSAPKFSIPPPEPALPPLTVIPETVTVPEFTKITERPLPIKVTLLPGVTGCTVIEVEMVKLAPLAGW